MKKKTWGGQRDGAGRPKVQEKRKLRALQFFDYEWELIKQKAQKKGVSPRAYLFSLAEQDNVALTTN